MEQKLTTDPELVNSPADDIVTLFFKRVVWVEKRKQLTSALVFIKTNGIEIKYSWEEYKDQTIYFAKGLIGQGIGPGDFVALIALNLPESFFAMLGTILTGAVPVPINIPLVKEPGQIELKAILNDCKPKLVLANEHLSPYLTEINHETFEIILARGELTSQAQSERERKIIYLQKKKNQLLIMPYTSGTSSEQSGKGLKGVMLSHDNILDRLEAVTRALQITRHERLLSYLLLGHISELMATFFGQIYKGYTVYFTEYAKEMVGDREKLRKHLPLILRRVKPTIFLAVPQVWFNIQKKIEKQKKFIPLFILSKLAKKFLGFHQTRHFVSAASKITTESLRFFKNLGIDIKDIYGQTETGGPVLMDGMPIGDIGVFLKKDPTSEDEDGEMEIVLSGKSIMLGYYKNEKATTAVTEKVFCDTGESLCYKSGDLGIKKNGRIICLGRKDDRVRLAHGEFVSSSKIHDLETCLKNIAGVEDVLLYGYGRSYLVALIFTAHQQGTADYDQLARNIKKQLPGIGEGLSKIGAFELLDKSGLEYTPTMKLRKRVMIKKFQKVIDGL